MLSCPEGLASLPGSGLPHLLYSAFWESADAAALIIKESLLDGVSSPDVKPELPVKFTRKSRWQRRRTTLKVNAKFGSIILRMSFLYRITNLSLECFFLFTI